MAAVLRKCIDGADDAQDEFEALTSRKKVAGAVLADVKTQTDALQSVNAFDPENPAAAAKAVAIQTSATRLAPDFPAARGGPLPGTRRQSLWLADARTRLTGEVPAFWCQDIRDKLEDGGTDEDGNAWIAAGAQFSPAQARPAKSLSASAQLGPAPMHRGQVPACLRCDVSG